MKVWFITGSSKGFGRIWAEAALERGDKVVVTARKLEAVQDLSENYGERVLPLTLDVTDKSGVEAAIKRAYEHFGRIDIVVNNAGYGQFGFIEELSEQEARDQLETNLFGALWVTQAALPYLREQKSGHIIQVSSIGGIVTFPGIGMYNASKWALEAFSQSLAEEVADLGIKVTIVEPTGFSTDWAGPSATHAKEIPAYAEVRKKVQEMRKQRISVPGDPKATASVMIKLVDLQSPPLRIFLGKGPNEMAHAEYARRLNEWDTYKEWSEEAHGNS